jgi:hypothetical protein
MITTFLKEGGSVSAFSGDGRMAFIKLENVSLEQISLSV